MTAMAIEIRGLRKRYRDVEAVRGIDLEVRRGEVFAFLGPNGAGKTTTVEIVEGYRSADGGTARVLGVDPAVGGRPLRARVGLMLQGGGIDPRAQPRETLQQYGRFHADPRDADELLELVGLSGVARTRYRRLSGGERQRLGLALALVGRPEVVILDEPTAGMDPEARATTRAIVADLRTEGAAILMTSHDLTDVERLADRIYVLTDGRIVAAGTPAELRAGVTARLRFQLDRSLAPDDVAALERALAAVRGGTTVGPDGDGVRYLVGGTVSDAAIIVALAGWCAIVGRLILELRTTGGSLEDAYLELVGGHAAAQSGDTS